MSRLSKAASRLPVYAVGRLAGIKQRLKAEGRDLIDLGAGDADLAPPAVAVETLAHAARDPSMSRYAFQVGLPRFRQSIASYLHRRFGVTVNPDTEILPLLGSKEGLAHLPMAILNHHDVAIVPEPGYPAYIGGTLMAHADPEIYPLRADGGYLVDPERLPPERLAKTRLVFLNYPNNPTTAVVGLEYLERMVALARRHHFLIAYDNPYCDLTFDGYVAPSILQVPGAAEVAVEFHSLSKSFSMTGWRAAWAVGNVEVLDALKTVKGYMDTGMFLAVQAACAATLDQAETLVPATVATFRERRDAGVTALASIGMPVEPPKGTMYLWVPLPAGLNDTAFAERCLEDEALVLLAGSVFGASGAGFARLALTVPPDRLRESVGRMGRVLERMR
ncbi:MAG: aminotransferase class I/II-fold pyridoxal phosphate-dependent enzyme [Gemmatimonadales bacterium]